jgi:hypothetical protein
MLVLRMPKDRNAKTGVVPFLLVALSWHVIRYDIT